MPQPSSDDAASLAAAGKCRLPIRLDLADGEAMRLLIDMMAPKNGSSQIVG